jgi:hypothetical protein
MMLTEIISPALSDKISFAKYARWACNISRESFAALLGAIDAFGAEYNCAMDATGTHPPALYESPKRAHVRLGRALEELAIIRKSLKARDYLELRSELSIEEGSAFSDEFRQYLQDGDDCVSWAACLSEDQLYILLWYVGEFACRVWSKWGEDESDFVVPSFDVPDRSNAVMKDALKTIVLIYKSGEN